ncbi:MAG: T9SS type A sorting domain-containing protein, partial [Candidatus Neomarinimicrobiota bacterium]
DPLKSDDFQNWPVDLGAPWVDEDGDGLYSPMPLGPDHPQFLGDQVIWYVMNDGDVAEHGAVFNTLPLGIEVQMTIWGYNRPDAFGDMMFVKALIINKGGNLIENTYIGLWNDPDLGDAADDFVGCDTTLSLGFVYNDGVDGDYGVRAPALGFDFFQGPLVASPGDTGFAYGKVQPGYTNLPMSSFNKYINTDDPAWSGPENAGEGYNLMQGFRKDGVEYRGPDGTVTKFIHWGDPVTEIGWIDADSHSSDDRRYMMNTGPFTLADGDSQEVVYGVIIAQGSNHLTSITLLKEVDALAQLAYDIQFALPPTPGLPAVTYSTQGDEINLMWDNTQETYVSEDPLDQKPVVESTTQIKEWRAEATIIDQYVYGKSAYDTMGIGEYRESVKIISTDPYIELPINLTGYKADSTYASPIILLGVVSDTFYTMKNVVVDEVTEYTTEPTTYVFEGYNIWQFDNATGLGMRRRIATFDKVNGITEIQDVVFDVNRGENVNVTVQHGEDAGVRNHFTVSSDYIQNGIPLKTNRVYYFAVTAYGYNPFGIPRTLESAFDIITIRPAIAIDLDVAAEGEEEFEDITHTTGISDGAVEVIVVDPLVVTGHDYEVSFADQDYYKDANGIWQTGTPPVAKGLGKVLDVSPSTATATAYVAGGGAGTIRIDFDFKLVSPDDNWADGFLLTFPSGIAIKSASVSGAINSGNQTPGFETATINSTANTVMWGNNDLSEWGAIEGNATFSVVVEPFDLPLSVDWLVYDDNYSGDATDGSGTVTVSALVYESATILIWNVKDLSTSGNVAVLQRVVSGTDALTAETYTDGDDAGWTFFDGIKIKVSGPAHTINSEGWDETGGAISPLFELVEEYTDANGDGLYTYAEAFEDVGVDAQVDQFELGYVDSLHVLVNFDPSDDDYDAEDNPFGSEGNGVYDPWPYPELFTDADADGVWDIGEVFSDLGTDTLASINEEGYFPHNMDPVGDNYDSTSAPLGTEGNLLYDVGEPYTDTNGDGSWTDAEAYIDSDSNKVYDAGYDTTGTWPMIVDSYIFYNWNPGSPIGGSDYPEVEVRFVEMQSYIDLNANGQWDRWEVYTYDTTNTNAGYADMYETWGAGHFSGFNRVPYSAWNMDTDPPTQLAIAQRDRQMNDQYDPGQGSVWNYIWITNVPYTGESIFDGSSADTDFLGLAGDALAPGLYGLWLDVDGPAFARAGTYTFSPARGNLAADKFVFSTRGVVAKAIDMDIINVWPNPYFAYNPEERMPVERIMQFTHLPPEATIRIFNLAGQQVRKIEHIDGSQYEEWNLTNNFNIPVASGMYIAYIESEHGEKILKLAVIQAEQRMDVY